VSTLDHPRAVKTSGDTLTFEELSAATAGLTGPIRIYLTDGEHIESVNVSRVEILELDDSTVAVLHSCPAYGWQLVLVPVQVAPAVQAVGDAMDSVLAETFGADRS
jgi:hypothetical protein